MAWDFAVCVGGPLDGLGSRGNGGVDFFINGHKEVSDVDCWQLSHGRVSVSKRCTGEFPFALHLFAHTSGAPWDMHSTCAMRLCPWAYLAPCRLGVAPWWLVTFSESSAQVALRNGVGHGKPQFQRVST